MIEAALWLGIGIVLALPLIPIVRSERKVTWSSAIYLGVLLSAITLVLLAEVPSRILYWFDAEHTNLAERFPVLSFMEDDVGGNPGYQLIADLVANTVQGMLFVVMAGLAYFWGENHRKKGRF